MHAETRKEFPEAYLHIHA